MDAILLSMMVSGLIGGVIGLMNSCPGSGAMFGALLGPVGWLLVACVWNYEPLCPECKSVVEEEGGAALWCKSCGVALVASAALDKDLPGSVLEAAGRSHGVK